MKVNIRKFIYLNCGKRNEQVNDHGSKIRDCCFFKLFIPFNGTFILVSMSGYHSYCDSEDYFFMFIWNSKHHKKCKAIFNDS